MEMKYFGVLLVALLLVLPTGFAATGKFRESEYGTGAASTDASVVRAACPTKSTIKVNCNAVDSAVASAREWTGADGCKYECEASPSTASSCPTKSAIKVNCDATDSASAAREWVGPDGCKYECAGSNPVMCPDAMPVCQGGTELYKYVDASGCTIYGCKAVSSGFSEVKAEISAEPQSAGVGDTIKAVGTVAYEQDPRMDARPSEKKFKVVISMQTGYGATDGTSPGGSTTGSPVPGTAPSAPVPSVSTQGAAPGEIRLASTDGWDSSILGSATRAISGIFGSRSPENTARDSNTASAGSDDGSSDSSHRGAPGGVAAAVSADVSSAQQERTDFITLKAGEKKSVEAYFTARNPGTKLVRMQVYEYTGSECPPATTPSIGAPCREIYREVANTATKVKVSGEAPPPFPIVVSTAAIELRPGWNMVSVPVNSKVDMRSVSEKCNSAAYGWRLAESGYAKDDVLVPGYGYWVKSSGSCRYEISGSSATTQLAQLFAGWNLVGAPGSEVALSSYTGSCQVTAGPWYYSQNAATDSASPYSYSAKLQPGRAYWIKVGSACTLGAVDDQPPIPPA